MTEVHELLKKSIYAIEDDKLILACTEVTKDLKFWEWPGSIDKHHAFPGGLAQHTLEVLTAAVRMGQVLGANTDYLRTAAVFHDCMKTRDYERTPEVIDGAKNIHPNPFRKTSYYSQIRHVSGGYAAWLGAAQKVGVSQEAQDAIGHIILSHHGRREWGSPAEPQTKEALIFHTADMLSAQGMVEL